VDVKPSIYIYMFVCDRHNLYVRDVVVILSVLLALSVVRSLWYSASSIPESSPRSSRALLELSVFNVLDGHGCGAGSALGMILYVICVYMRGPEIQGDKESRDGVVMEN